MELYYNEKLMADLGIALPVSRQFDAAQFLELTKKAKARAGRRCRWAWAIGPSPART